jgi:hypothetical protein
MWLWLPDEGEASCAYGSLGSDQAITKSDIADYKVSVCSYFDRMSGGCSLAVSRSGAWGTGCGSTDSLATNSAIAECQRYAQQHESCTLVDLRAESKFIKEFKSPEQIALEEARRLGEEKQRKAEATRIAAEKKQKEQEEKQRQLKLAQAEAEKQKQAEADTAQKQAGKEQHAQQLAASRNRLFEGILKVRTLMQENPDYPQKSGVDETLKLAITRLSLNDLTPLQEAEAMLVGVVRDVGIYEERQGEKAQRKALVIAKAKKQAEEEKQRQLKLAQAEAEKQKQAELAALERTTASTRVNIKVNAPQLISEPEPVGESNLTVTEDSITQSSQPTEADKNIELEFWQSIKDSNNRNMYREYLRQFPSGVYSGLAKIKLQELSADKKVQAASIPNLDYGDYYALVIGNNNYQDLTNLRSAVNDAKVVSTVLEVDYGFNVKLLENASRKDILRSLKHLRETVSAKDNVLIYYAGHGYLDEAADQGYWLPVDSERDDDSNWIATDRVVSQIKAMQAKHVMVVADSCFSGTITRAIKIEQRTPEWLSEIVKKKARTALTSGGLEPVMDTGSGNHSAFANAFISLLEGNDGVLDASQLFSKLRPKVMANATQTPEYGKIHMAGDDGGDFLFVRQ